MGKPLGTVEYAYPMDILVDFNRENEGKFQHTIEIVYELLADSGAILKTQHKARQWTTTETLDTAGKTQALGPGLYEQIRQDKIGLSGYDIGPP